jgi:ParB family chromosome partitioning protein
MRLGAVSAKLKQVYRDGGLNVDQLMAFAITEDHARQEQVYENLTYRRLTVAPLDAHKVDRDVILRHLQAFQREAAVL